MINIKKLFLLITILLFPIKVVVSSSYIVMDMERGRVLEGNNINEQKLTSSISKIMTAYVTIQNNNILSEIVVNNSILTSYGSGIYIKPGENYY